MYRQFMDPTKDPVEVKDKEVISYPKMAEFSQVNLLAERFDVQGKQLVITQARPIESAA